MRLLSLAPLFLLPLAFAQSSTTSSTQPSASGDSSGNSTSTNTTSAGNSSQTILTTTLTTYPTTTLSGQGTPSPSTLVLTLTLSTTDLSSVNASIANGSLTNGTIPADGTEVNGTAVWKEGDGWIPFNVVIDPAYGILGAFLILTGIPVAVLGGKNRWSSLAIASGYTLMMFTLVMILRFGVQPNLQGPTIHPPNRTLRGLYLLACIISSFIGAGLGIFFFNFAKYWVSAAGGFCFGWFLLATRQGGLIQSVLGRWGLLGSLTVVAFVASLPKVMNPHMMLASTGWMGATAFVLGADCYTRAGLKEFYIYNLGFHELFPKLDGAKYPLTQTMIIELGILAAVVVIGAAIQFRVLNMLQKRLKMLRDEEEMRLEAEEVSKAAERFKNLGAELNQWEEKHGEGAEGSKKGCAPSSGPSSPRPDIGYTYPGAGAGRAESLHADRSSVLLPQLGFEDEHEQRRDGRGSSTLSLLGGNTDTRGGYEGVALSSPAASVANFGGAGTVGTPTSAMFIGVEELKPEHPVRDESDLEEKLRLLEEVKKARESVRGSLNQLRKGTPTPSMRSFSGGSRTGAVTPGAMEDAGHVRRVSTASSRILDHPILQPIATEPPATSAPKSEWDAYLAERRVITPTSAVTPPGSAPGNPNRGSQQFTVIPAAVAKAMERRERTTSMLEPRVSDFGPSEQVTGGTYPPLGAQGGRGYDYPPQAMDRRSSAGRLERPASTHDYLSSGLPPSRPASQADILVQPQPQYHSHSRQQSNASYFPPVIGSAAQGHSSSTRPTSRSSQHRPASAVLAQPQRAMTYEELADRHRKRMSQLQMPLTTKMQEQVDVEEAKQRWEKRNRAEKEEMRRRELAAAAAGPSGSAAHVRGPGGGGKGKGKEEVIKDTDQWRRSVIMGAPPQAAKPAEKRPDKRASKQFAS
ncbi:hypothetical protein IAT38_007253 [Cryptococcus sp. DSM 104549]